MKARIFKLDKDIVDEIFYVMKNPQLREIYDKSELFIRKKTLKHKPTEGARYLSAFQEVSSFLMFIVLSLVLIK